MESHLTACIPNRCMHRPSPEGGVLPGKSQGSRSGAAAGSSQQTRPGSGLSHHQTACVHMCVYKTLETAVQMFTTSAMLQPPPTWCRQQSRTQACGNGRPALASDTYRLHQQQQRTFPVSGPELWPGALAATLSPITQKTKHVPLSPPPRQHQHQPPPAPAHAHQPHLCVRVCYTVR